MSCRHPSEPRGMLTRPRSGRHRERRHAGRGHPHSRLFNHSRRTTRCIVESESASGNRVLSYNRDGGDGTISFAGVTRTGGVGASAAGATADRSRARRPHAHQQRHRARRHELRQRHGDASSRSTART